MDLKWPRISVLFVPLLAWSALSLSPTQKAFAHGGGHDHDRAEHSDAEQSKKGCGQCTHCGHCEPAGLSTKPVVKTPEESEKAVIRQLIDIFHHAIDGEHSHSETWKDKLKALLKKETWKQWARGLNPVRLRRHAYRAYHMQKNKDDLKEHALNLAMVVPISHGLEMAAAPVFALATSALDLPTWFVAGGASGLSLIAIPGLDPICIMLFAIYPLPPVHKTLTSVQRSVRWAVRAAKIRLQDPKRLEEIAREERTDRLTALRLLSDQVQWSEEFVVEVSTVAGQAGKRTLIEISDRVEGRDIATLSFYEENTQATTAVNTDDSKQASFVRYLEAVQFGSTWRNQDAARLARFANLFHWNVREAIVEAVRAKARPAQLDDIRNLFYIKSATVDGVLYTPRAVHFPRGSLQTVAKHYGTIVQECAGLLLGTSTR